VPLKNVLVDFVAVSVTEVDANFEAWYFFFLLVEEIYALQIC